MKKNPIRCPTARWKIYIDISRSTIPFRVRGHLCGKHHSSFSLSPCNESDEPKLVELAFNSKTFLCSAGFPYRGRRS
jgi:hypothetical protein